MRWTDSQVSQATSLRAACEVDERSLLMFAEELSRKLKWELVASGHALGLEMDPRDIVIETARRRAVGRWLPSVRTVELVGGHSDGLVLAFASAPHQELRLPQPAAPLFLRESPDRGPDAVVDMNVVIYRMGGWDEGERRWLYMPA